MSPPLSDMAAPPPVSPRDRAAPCGAGVPAVEWEHSACPLCGGRNGEPVLEAPDARAETAPLWFAVVRCPECDLSFTNPRPRPASMAHFYPPVYQPHRPPTHRHRRRWRGERVPTWSRRSKERQLLPWHGQGRLLDFGCGGGVFLERMHLQGWRITGIDVSSAAVLRIQRELALPAYVGTLPHPALPPAGFDVITMWHSLEHVHAPLEVLREAHRLLAPGGKLLIAVPNIDSLPFRWFGPSWFALDLPRHLTHFTPPTLRLMLERAGLRPGPVRMVRHSGWLRSSAQRSCRDGGPSWHRWLTLKPAARLATWCCALARRADCIMVSATA